MPPVAMAKRYDTHETARLNGRHGICPKQRGLVIAPLRASARPRGAGLLVKKMDAAIMYT